jgi:hypothetical protein
MALTPAQADSVVKAEFRRIDKGKPPLFAKARARLDARVAENGGIVEQPTISGVEPTSRPKLGLAPPESGEK